MVEELNLSPSKVKPVSGLGAYVFENGKYVGDWLDFKRDGQGTFIFTKSNIYKKYVGKWSEDAPNGKGILFFQDGTTYEGNFRNWVPSGDGVRKYLDGREYHGLWFDGKKEDKHGLLLLNGKEEYSGGFKDDKYHGYGRLRYNNGDVYEGEFINGFRQGKGKMKFVKGGIFEGVFFNGALDGEGIYKLPNGDVYKGMFSGPVISGTANGKVEYSNGSVLECPLVGWKLNGIATWTNKDGSVVCSEYKDGRQIHILDENETLIGQLFELESEPNHYVVTKIKGHQRHVIFPSEYLGKSIEKILLNEIEYPEEIEVLEFGNENETFIEKSENLLKSLVNLKKIVFGKKMYEFPIKKFSYKLEQLDIYKGGHYYKNNDGVYFKDDGSLFWFKYRGKNVPYGTEIISSKGLKHAYKDVFIPKSVNYIHYDAFNAHVQYTIHYEGSKSDWRKITVIGPNGEEISGFFLDPLKSIRKFYKDEEPMTNKIKFKCSPLNNDD